MIVRTEHNRINMILIVFYFFYSKKQHTNPFAMKELILQYKTNNFIGLKHHSVSRPEIQSQKSMINSTNSYINRITVYLTEEAFTFFICKINKFSYFFKILF